MSITLVRKSPSKLWLLALAVLAVGVYVLWQYGRAQQKLPPQASAARGKWPDVGPTGAEHAQTNRLTGPVGESRPADFTPEDWDALNKALAHEPNQALERKRLVSYLRFQRMATRWSELHDSADATERKRLAREVVAQMPEHLANGDINVGQATLFLMALSGDLAQDPSSRQAWVEAQRAQLPIVLSEDQAKNAQNNQYKDREFARMKAETIANWLQSPAGARDPAMLALQLQALHEQVYTVEAH